MASIIVRNIGEDLKQRLRVRAAEHGHSMEQEARDILSAALAGDAEVCGGLGTALHELFAPWGCEELEIAPREPIRVPALPE